MLQPKYVNWLTWSSVSSFIIISVATEINLVILKMEAVPHFETLEYLATTTCKIQNKTNISSTLFLPINTVRHDLLQILDWQRSLVCGVAYTYRLSTVNHRFNPFNMYTFKYMCLTKTEILATGQTHSLATEAPGQIWLQWSASILK